MNHDKLREAIRVMRQQADGTPISLKEGAPMLRLVCDAAESTLPKTKMVEVWRVEYATNSVPMVLHFLTHAETERWIKGAEPLAYISCIRVTGPHQQEVPA